MHWVQDCQRASNIPNHENFDEETMYVALSLAQIRKSDNELVTTISKAGADTGKFMDERKWPKWEKAIINYLLVGHPWGKWHSYYVCTSTYQLHTNGIHVCHHQ